MNRLPFMVAYLAAELLEVAKAMADGSYYKEALDPQIHLCGEGSTYENWGGGEGD